MRILDDVNDIMIPLPLRHSQSRLSVYFQKRSHCAAGHVAGSGFHILRSFEERFREVGSAGALFSALDSFHPRPPLERPAESSFKPHRSAFQPVGQAESPGLRGERSPFQEKPVFSIMSPLFSRTQYVQIQVFLGWGASTSPPRFRQDSQLSETCNRLCGT